MKNRIITVRDTEVSISTWYEQDYISLTDMVRNFDGGSALIEQWLKNKDTVLFLGVWEQLNNPASNSLEFEGIRNDAGRNSFFFIRVQLQNGPPLALTEDELTAISREIDLVCGRLVTSVQGEQWNKQTRSVFENKTDCRTVKGRLMAALAQQSLGGTQ